MKQTTKQTNAAVLQMVKEKLPFNPLASTQTKKPVTIMCGKENRPMDIGVDGEDHISISPHGATQLGRFLSTVDETVFQLDINGVSHSVRSLAAYEAALRYNDREFLMKRQAGVRELKAAYHQNTVGKSRPPRIPGFFSELQRALFEKLKAHPEMVNELATAVRGNMPFYIYTKNIVDGEVVWVEDYKSNWVRKALPLINNAFRNSRGISLTKCPDFGPLNQNDGKYRHSDNFNGVVVSKPKLVSEGHYNTEVLLYDVDKELRGMQWAEHTAYDKLMQSVTGPTARQVKGWQLLQFGIVADFYNGAGESAVIQIVKVLVPEGVISEKDWVRIHCYMRRKFKLYRLSYDELKATIRAALYQTATGKSFSILMPPDEQISINDGETQVDVVFQGLQPLVVNYKTNLGLEIGKAYVKMRGLELDCGNVEPLEVNDGKVLVQYLCPVNGKLDKRDIVRSDVVLIYWGYEDDPTGSSDLEPNIHFFNKDGLPIEAKKLYYTNDAPETCSLESFLTTQEAMKVDDIANSLEEILEGDVLSSTILALNGDLGETTNVEPSLQEGLSVDQLPANIADWGLISNDDNVKLESAATEVQTGNVLPEVVYGLNVAEHYPSVKDEPSDATVTESSQTPTESSYQSEEA